MNLSITPGINNVGAYINDIDLKILNKEQAKEIKNILNQFGVVFIKKQNLDPESYQKFAKDIGQPVVYPRLEGLEIKFHLRPDASVKLSTEIVSVASVSTVPVNAKVAPLSVAI